MSIKELVQNEKFKNLLTKLYGFGASVVILGALFKIQHWTGAGFMLAAGLITEAIIFFFYAFDQEPKPETFDDTHESEKTPDGLSEELQLYSGKQSDSFGGGNGSLALAKFDEMLEKADITSELFHNLGVGMKKLGETTINMNSMGDVSAASIKYMNTIKTADESLGKLAKTYQTTIIKVIDKTAFNYKNIADSLTIIESGVKSYQQQLESLNKNLASLNAVYILQKKEADDYLKNMIESTGDSKKYREQMIKLNDNLSALNNVYGNMLSAMNVKR